MRDIIEELIAEMGPGSAVSWCDREYLGGLSDCGVSAHEPVVLAALTRLVCRRCKDVAGGVAWSELDNATIGDFDAFVALDADHFESRLESLDRSILVINDSLPSVDAAKRWAERAAVALMGVSGDE